MVDTVIRYHWWIQGRAISMQFSGEWPNNSFSHPLLRYKHTECQASRQAVYQASTAAAVVGPHRLVLAAYLDAPNLPQTPPNSDAYLDADA